MPSRPFRPHRISLAVLAAIPLLAFSFTSAATAAPETIIDDVFEDGDATGSADHRNVWTVQTLPGSQNGIFERNGYLTLLAAGKPYSYACINSTLDDRLNVFKRPVTITVEDFVMNHHALETKDTIFRLSLNSTELRQHASPHSITLRFGPSIALLGFKTQPVAKFDAENLQGPETGSACVEKFDGKLTGFTLALDPRAQPGVITYTLILQTNGTRPAIVRTGTLTLTAADWADGGRSALILETRRNTATTDPDSYVSASIGRIVVTAEQ